jgi:hypothetical protein
MEPYADTLLYKTPLGVLSRNFAAYPSYWEFIEHIVRINLTQSERHPNQTLFHPHRRSLRQLDQALHPLAKKLVGTSAKALKCKLAE